MRSRLELIDFIREVLARAGYYVSQRCDIRPVSFDVVARRDSELVILKVLTNIDALSERVAAEMRLLARFLGGRAIVVGERSGAGALDEGVIYYRYQIPIISPPTFVEAVLHEMQPLVYAAPGGYYVRLDGDALQRLRRERNLTLGELAQAAGVSRRTISMYEEGMSATVEAALRLQEFLAAEIIRPLMGEPPQEEPAPTGEVPDVLETTDGFEREVYHALKELGYEVVATERSPFNALSSQRETLILTSVTRDDGDVVRKARLISSLSEVTERPGVFFMRRSMSRTTIEGSAVITQEELARARDPEDIVQLIRERRGRVKAD